MNKEQWPVKPMFANGPWEVGEIIDGIASIDAPYAEIPHTGLAQAVYSLNYGDKPSLVEEANVHLITAAPDMYDCLCLLRQLFARQIDKGEKFKKKHMLVCIEDIDLVLAHARGEDFDA